MSKQQKHFSPVAPPPRSVAARRGRFVQVDLGDTEMQSDFYDLREKYNTPTKELLRQMVEFCLASYKAGQKETDK